MLCLPKKVATPVPAIPTIVLNAKDNTRGLNLKGWGFDRYVSPDGDASWPAVAHTTIRPRLAVTLQCRAGEGFGFTFETTDPFDPDV